MAQQVKPPFLEEQREHTDKSLVTERGVTDRSLSRLQNKTEKVTDESLKRDRQNADKNRSQTRSENDHEKDLIRNQGDAGSHQKKSTSQQDSDDRLKEQRYFDDVSIAVERSQVDAAMARERGIRVSSAGDLLDRERKKTDENLSLEREETDSVFDENSVRFKEEIKSHATTKTALTSRDEFLAIVSHDLKNPIGAILSCAEMLMNDNRFASRDQDLQEWIELIHRNAQSSIHLISDLLDMERLAIGKVDLKITSQDILRLAQEAVKNYLHLALVKKIKLVLEPTEGVRTAPCDHERISQVLSNLIGNAIKFTPPNGLVRLTIKQIPNFLQISVIDTGPGIADDHQDKIFDRFAQISNKDRQGLGLGLYISKMLVEEHHGKIWVESSLGEGSQFFFTLPNTIS